LIGDVERRPAGADLIGQAREALGPPRAHHDFEAFVDQTSCRCFSKFPPMLR